MIPDWIVRFLYVLLLCVFIFRPNLRFYVALIAILLYIFISSTT